MSEAHITVGGTTWTSPAETIRVNEYIYEKMAAKGKDEQDRLYHIHGVVPPQCSVCTRTTCFIVEMVKSRSIHPSTIAAKEKRREPLPEPKWAPKKSGIAAILNFTGSAVYLSEEKTHVYIPVTLCHECGGSRDGFNDGYKHPKEKGRTLARLRRANLTEGEKQEYLKAYEKSWIKGCDKLTQWEEEHPKRGKARYKEK